MSDESGWLDLPRTAGVVRHPGERRNLSKSAVRALDVLEHLAAAGRPLRAADIVQAFGWHPSSTDQLLKTMVDAAYLLIDPVARLYYPSPRLLRFATWLGANYFGGEGLPRLVEALAAETGQIVTLSAPNGAYLQLVDVAEPAALAGMVRKGSRVPILGSTLGEAFLATYSDQDILRWADRTAESRKMDPAAFAELLHAIATIREQGYACGVSDPTDLMSLALALPKAGHGAQLVLGLAGRREGIAPHRKDLIAAMRSAVTTHLGK